MRTSYLAALIDLESCETCIWTHPLTNWGAIKYWNAVKSQQWKWTEHQIKAQHALHFSLFSFTVICVFSFPSKMPEYQLCVQTRQTQVSHRGSKLRLDYDHINTYIHEQHFCLPVCLYVRLYLFAPSAVDSPLPHGVIPNISFVYMYLPHDPILPETPIFRWCSSKWRRLPPQTAAYTFGHKAVFFPAASREETPNSCNQQNSRGPQRHHQSLFSSR